MIGRIVESGIQEIKIGCGPLELGLIGIGKMVRVSIIPDIVAYSVVSNIRIPENEMVRQIAQSIDIPETLLTDQRRNRLVPVEITSITVGYKQGNLILHRLPGLPPAILEPVLVCEPAEIIQFISSCDYLRFLVNHPDPTRFDLIITHLELMDVVQTRAENSDWLGQALRKLTALLKGEPDLAVQILKSEEEKMNKNQFLKKK